MQPKPRARILASLVSAIVSFALLLSACSPAAPAAPSKSAESKPAPTAAPAAAKPAEPIVVGVVAPVSGDFVSLGEDAVNAIKLAVEQINQKGGVLGRPFNVIIEDGATDPTISLNAVTKLTTQNKVVGLLGTLCSGCTIGALPAIKNAKVPFLTIGDGGLKIAQGGNKNTFLITDTDTARAEAMVDAVKNHFKVKNLGILVSEKSEPGKTAQQVIEKQLAGTDVKVTSVIAPTNAPDYRPYLTKLRDAGAQVIFNGGSTGEEMALILRQMQDLKMTVPTVGMLWVDTMVKASSPEAASIYYFTTPYLPSFDTPEAKSFTSAYKTKFQRDPSKYSAISFTSTWILATAIEQAKSTDPDAVIDQIRKATWVGPLGKPKIDETGLWSVTTHLAKYNKDGNLSLVYTPKQ